MSTGLSAIDRDLLRNLDYRVRDPYEAGTSIADVVAPPQDTRPDIAGILEAVQLTASSIAAMAGRIAELEAHTQAFEDANDDLESRNRRLSVELDEAAQQQNALATSLEAEHDLMLKIESFATDQVLRATGLERDLSTAQSDLGKIAEAVRSLPKPSTAQRRQ